MLALALYALAAGLSGSPHKVPLIDAPAPILDGEIGVEEWRGASEFRLVDGGRILVRADKANLYLAAVYPQPAASSVDIFLIGSAGHPLDLHASAKVGQRVRKNGTWSEFDWGGAEDWSSHATSRDPETRRYRLDDAREFRISRGLLPPRSVPVSVTISDAQRSVWPAGASEDDIAAWALLGLE